MPRASFRRKGHGQKNPAIRRRLGHMCSGTFLALFPSRPHFTTTPRQSKDLRGFAQAPRRSLIRVRPRSSASQTPSSFILHPSSFILSATTLRQVKDRTHRASGLSSFILRRRAAQFAQARVPGLRVPFLRLRQTIQHFALLLRARVSRQRAIRLRASDLARPRGLQPGDQFCVVIHYFPVFQISG